jgi:CRISPR/Cas system Type II protein with McrA/HNH and RuvC-like nuclease domain
LKFPLPIDDIYGMISSNVCLAPRGTSAGRNKFVSAALRLFSRTPSQETLFIKQLKTDIAKLRRPVIACANMIVDRLESMPARQYENRNDILKERLICKIANLMLAYLLRRKGYDAKRYEAPWLISPKIIYDVSSHMITFVKIPSRRERIIVDPAYFQFIPNCIRITGAMDKHEDILVMKESDIKATVAAFAKLSHENRGIVEWGLNKWNYYYARIWDLSLYKPYYSNDMPELEYYVQGNDVQKDFRDAAMLPGKNQIISLLKKLQLA